MSIELRVDPLRFQAIWDGLCSAYVGPDLDRRVATRTSVRLAEWERCSRCSGTKRYHAVCEHGQHKHSAPCDACDPDGGMRTGRQIYADVTHVVGSLEQGVAAGYCVASLKILEKRDR